MTASEVWRFSSLCVGLPDRQAQVASEEPSLYAYCWNDENAGLHLRILKMSEKSCCLVYSSSEYCSLN